MSLFKRGVVLDYKLTSSYERLRQKLRTKFADRLDTPLAFWALPADRHLPLALISRSLRDLLACSLNELYSTPGIGPKKISALLVLLARATQPLVGEHEPQIDFKPPSVGADPAEAAIDIKTVSEAVWAQWRARVRQFGLEKENLGRFAPTLERLPRMLWVAPLNIYLDLSLVEIRKLKTHGQKRVGAVLEVFGCLNEVLHGLQAPSHLIVRIMPRRVVEIENWVNHCLERPSLATVEALQQSLIAPLLEQIRQDAGSQSSEIAATLLRQRPRNVQEVARRIGLKRGRVYELLTDIGAIVTVRWPEGQARLASLTRKLAEMPEADRQIGLLTAAMALFFPEPDSSSEGD